MSYNQDEDRLLAQLEAIFDRRGLTESERETVVSTLTKLLVGRPEGASSVPISFSKWERALANAAAEDPELLQRVEQNDYAEGTVGAWLKKAIEEERLRQTAPNVVDLESRRKKDQS